MRSWTSYIDEHGQSLKDILTVPFKIESILQIDTERPERFDESVVDAIQLSEDTSVVMKNIRNSIASEISTLHKVVWKQLYTDVYEPYEVVTWLHSLTDSLERESFIASKLFTNAQFIIDNVNSEKRESTVVLIEFFMSVWNIYMKLHPDVIATCNNIATAYDMLHIHKEADEPEEIRFVSVDSQIESMLMKSALLEASQTPVVLEFGKNAEERTVPFVLKDVRIYDNPPDNATREDVAVQNEELVKERANRKSIALACYNLFKDADESFIRLHEILINPSNADETSVFGIAMKLLNLNVKLFSVQFKTTGRKFDHVISRFDYELTAVAKYNSEAKQALFGDNPESIKPLKENNLYRMIIDYYNDVTDVLEYFCNAYVNYGKHCVAQFNPGWDGRPFDVYTYNSLDMKYDKTVYECVELEKHWYGTSKQYYKSEV